MPSSVVAAMKYNESSATLRIIYTSGSVYDYKQVPPDVFEQMNAAASKGTFLNTMIKGKYRYKKIR
ncbi:KTSC domain-containing protein [Mucilaginibacter xinganensis]|uniref:KTSC domain-containing protein n=1 Tax=Mucilaginibacter xinganensis TaxID=1234841 RepID=A0A223NSH4_9SPHI|nr:KTSC domain-containing protein [Mucilaginibacter xinganensis]ASU32787.1 KTSC domain-containing protein [Mucilaginibacter xinganensis]